MLFLKKITGILILNQCSTEMLPEYKSIKEEAFYNDTIGSAAGQLYAPNNSRFDVIRIGGILDQEIKNKTISSTGINFYFVGRTRIDAYTQYDTQFLNNHTAEYLTYIAPGKNIIDIGIGCAAGKNIGYNQNIINLGFDLRSTSTWGKPQSAESTSLAIMFNERNIDHSTITNHIHTTIIPSIYLRGADLTINLNPLLFKNPETCPPQKLKLGFFPFEIGRGISLGAVYKTSSDLISYAAVDAIQQFAPGFLLQGDCDSQHITHYKLYTGIMQNFSQIHFSNNAKKSLRLNNGLFNIVSALQIDWQYHNYIDEKMIISPYIIVAHEGVGNVNIPNDSCSNLLTYGFAIEGEKNNIWEIAFEFASNLGSQKIFGIDNNTLIKDQYICPIQGTNSIINQNTSINVLTNSDVIFAGYTSPQTSRTTDIINQNCCAGDFNSIRQKKINSQYHSSYNNGKKILINDKDNQYFVQNSPSRFTDTRVNNYNGFMAVCDIAKYIYIHGQKCKLALAAGFASGDSIIPNPEKRNSLYDGFISLQEMYSGKMVISAFLMNGIKDNIHGITSTQSTQYALLKENSVAPDISPSPFNGFTNIMYIGSSLLIIHETKSYVWKWMPNILLYAQPAAEAIGNSSITDILPKQTLDPYLGTEINLFLEIISQQIDTFKIFFVGSLLFPGQYYRDFANYKLDQTDSTYAYNYAQLQKNIIGYCINFGFEFYF